MAEEAVLALYDKVTQVLTGIELPGEVPVEKGFVIDHAGGIVMSGHAGSGDHGRVQTGVVLGVSRVNDRAAGVIGNHVGIGAGARVLGRIVIGSNVSTGANARVPAVVKSRRRS